MYRQRVIVDVKAYLSRIGIEEKVEPNLENLRKIQSSHLLNVPFENLNIQIYHRLSPDPGELFEKIILGRRGGVCYELNFLYMLLLRELGYRVSFFGGRTAADGSFFDHSFPMVEIDGKKYITDVGFGDNFLYPLEFAPDLRQTDPKGVFTIEYEGGGYYTVYKEIKQSKQGLYTFILNRRTIEDFTERKIYYCTDSSSHFHKNLIVSIERENGRVSLKQNKILYTENGKRRTEKVDGFHHYINLLYNNFGIVLTPEERRRLRQSRYWNKRFSRRKAKALLMASSIQQTIFYKAGIGS